MAKSWILRPTNQQKCFDKAKNKSKFLIAAKCRFGKTFVASEIAFTGWCAHKVLTIAGYSSLKDEWDKTIKSQYPEKSKYFEFQTLQILKTGTKRNEIIGRNKGCVLIFDEAHFGERTTGGFSSIDKVGNYAAQGYEFKTVEEKENICYWWYNSKIASYLCWGLKKQSFGRGYLPRINWNKEGMSKEDYTDDYVIKELGLKWKDENDPIKGVDFQEDKK